MSLRHRDERRGAATIGVGAFRLPDGWRFRVDVDEPAPGGTLHTEAVGNDPYADVDSALEGGLAWARWLVDGRHGAPPATVRASLAERLPRQRTGTHR